MSKRWTDSLAKSRGHKTKTANKYGAVRTSCGLHSHASKGESECCGHLQLLEKAGELEILKSQPNVFLTEARIRIIPDWLLRYRDGSERYADLKGYDGQSWLRNKKLWKAFATHPLDVWRKSHRGFFISETIQGKEGNECLK